MPLVGYDSEHMTLDGKFNYEKENQRTLPFNLDQAELVHVATINGIISLSLFLGSLLFSIMVYPRIIKKLITQTSGLASPGGSRRAII